MKYTITISSARKSKFLLSRVIETTDLAKVMEAFVDASRHHEKAYMVEVVAVPA
jgi:hypothetical protein